VTRNAQNATKPAVEQGSGEHTLSPRLDRLRALRSAWGVLAPSGLSTEGEQIAETGRQLTAEFATIMKSSSDPSPAALADVDAKLGRFESSIRSFASALPIPQLRSTLPAYRASNRRGLLDLLDVLALQVDNIITDYPADVRALLAGRGQLTDIELILIELRRQFL